MNDTDRGCARQRLYTHLRPLALVALMAGSAEAQELMPPTASGWQAFAPRAEIAPGTQASQGTSGYSLKILGNGVPGVYGGWRTSIQGLSGQRYYRFRARALPLNVTNLRESVTILLRWRGAYGDEVAPDYVWDFRPQTDGTLLFDRVIASPPGTTAVDIELALQWASNGQLTFDQLSFMPAATPAPRPVRVAAIYFRPSGSPSGQESVRQAAVFAEQVASANQPDILILGEMLNVIGAPGTLASKAETIPGPSTDVMAGVAQAYQVYIVFGMLEREGGLLYNTAVLLDRNGDIIGKYRKVQLPLQEAYGGVAPGATVPVFDTDFGRVALLICQDLSFPEPARQAAFQGAEMLLVPFWGGRASLVRARAVEHGIYVVTSGYDYPSEVINPLGTVVASAAIGGPPKVAIANIDLGQVFREPYLGFWHDAANKERRTAPYTLSPPDGPPPPADEPPDVSITAPASGATVSGTVTITASASDDVGVAGVRFLVDGTQLGAEDTTAPYSISWNTTTAANGSHTLTATARDSSGQVASSSIPVNVSNGGGGGVQPVTWTSLVNVSVSGSTLTKTSGCEGCQDAGAVSVQSIPSGDGYVELTASETNTQRMIGLSRGNTDTTAADIDFAVWFWPGGGLGIRENGVYRSIPTTTYVRGDVFRIAVVSGVVKYYRNGTLFFTSPKAPSYPLLVDTSFLTRGGTLTAVVISGAQ
jgi:predicted amidohydrolase